MSERWCCFIRAINTGDRRVTNEVLLAALTSFGLGDVAAYQATGNLTFLVDADAVPDESALADRLGADLGFACPVFLRSASELRTIVDTCPFTADDLAATQGRVQLTFLHDAPDRATTEAMTALVPADDRVAVTGREWWWLPKEGISTSKLPVARIEGLAGPMTMRTLATVERFLVKFGR